MYDNATEKNNLTNKTLKDIEKRVSQLEQKQNDTEEHMQETNEKITDVRWRSMRENLLFFGIPECDYLPENGENCEAKIKDFIKSMLDINTDISIDRAHRLGRYNRRNLRPRPIVVKFTFFKDRELVRSASRQALTGTDFGISEQFPQEIEEKRKKLYSVAKKARENVNNKVNLVRDKLYINGQLYIPNTEGTTKDDRYRAPYRNNRDDPATSNTRERSRGVNVSNRAWTRTYTRTTQNGAQTNNTADDIQHNNRFSVLAETTPNNPPPYRAWGKKKATSPLEQPGTFKKQNYDGNSSADESQIDIDLTQAPDDSQRSPSILNNISHTNNRQTPPPTESITLEPSPMVTLSSQACSTGFDCSSTQTHVTDNQPARANGSD